MIHPIVSIVIKIHYRYSLDRIDIDREKNIRALSNQAYTI